MRYHEFKAGAELCGVKVLRYAHRAHGLNVVVTLGVSGRQVERTTYGSDPKAAERVSCMLAAGGREIHASEAESLITRSVQAVA